MKRCCFIFDLFQISELSTPNREMFSNLGFICAKTPQVREGAFQQSWPLTLENYVFIRLSSLFVKIIIAIFILSHILIQIRYYFPCMADRPVFN